MRRSSCTNDVPLAIQLVAAKEREKAAKAQAQQNKKGTTTQSHKAAPGGNKTAGPSSNTARGTTAMDQGELDMAGLNLNDDAPMDMIPEEPVKPPAAIEKLIEEAKTVIAAQEKGEKRSLSMVVVGAFDLPSVFRAS